MQLIRVLVLRMPDLLHRIVIEALISEPGFEVIVDDGALSLLDAIEDHRAEVLITAFESMDELERVGGVLFSRPELKVLAIRSEGRDAVLCELRPHGVQVRDISGESLVAAIKQAVSRPRVFHV